MGVLLRLFFIALLYSFLRNTVLTEDVAEVPEEGEPEEGAPEVGAPEEEVPEEGEMEEEVPEEGEPEEEVPEEGEPVEEVPEEEIHEEETEVEETGGGKADTHKSGKGCTLSLWDDFGSPMPIFKEEGSPRLNSWKHFGPIIFQKDTPANLIIQCPGQSIVLNGSTIPTDHVKAECHSSKITVKSNNKHQTLEYKDVRCSGFLKSSAIQYNKATCDAPNNNVGRLYGINFRNRFDYDSGATDSVYEACISMRTNGTLYVKYEQHVKFMYTMTVSKRQRKYVEDPGFRRNMAKIYEFENQKARLTELLGEQAIQYFNETRYLRAVQLAPALDFALETDIIATFHSLNSAPLWTRSRGEEDDWSFLEYSIRSRMHLKPKLYQVYTGTHGVLRLDDACEESAQIYLDKHKKVPVPLYFYKVIIDPGENNQPKITAFVTINLPTYNRALVKRLTFCNNMCKRKNPSFRWLKWGKDGGRFTFCCKYLEFSQEINLFFNGKEEYELFF